MPHVTEIQRIIRTVQAHVDDTEHQLEDALQEARRWQREAEEYEGKYQSALRNRFDEDEYIKKEDFVASTRHIIFSLQRDDGVFDIYDLNQTLIDIGIEL